MARRQKQKLSQADIARINFGAAEKILGNNPIFGPLLRKVSIYDKVGTISAKGYAIAEKSGNIRVNLAHVLQPMEWVYVLGHCLLHFGFGHFQEKSHSQEWNAACDCIIARFLQDIKLAPIPSFLSPPPQNLPSSEEHLYQDLCAKGSIPEEVLRCGLAGPGYWDMDFDDTKYIYRKNKDPNYWTDLLAQGIANAVTEALEDAAGIDKTKDEWGKKKTKALRARDWFISNYPLLGSLAASFEIIEDRKTCQMLNIQIAAVDDELRKIYISPLGGLNEEECKFVMAHEILHAALRHSIRRQGRDPYLWNISTDFTIDGWLKEMQIGEMPSVGILYDPDLQGLSSESIYDRIVTNLRKYRKLMTFRGQGIGDILSGGHPEWWSQSNGVSLDEFYRRSLAQGLLYHQESKRGFLPAGLVEEIRAQSHPPIPWDVELAQWFDGYFSPLEMTRTYARPSRRQSSTPDIPRARWVPAAGAEDARTFGVVLDTSISMSHAALAKALGAIANYCVSRDVPYVRVVFCDAAAYDEGYMSPEDIAYKVKVKGRGGTVLQPGIDVIEKAKDFPKEGPILIITDGMCDSFKVKRDHAILIPLNGTLPFIPKGKVLRMDYKIPKPERMPKS